MLMLQILQIVFNMSHMLICLTCLSLISKLAPSIYNVLITEEYNIMSLIMGSMSFIVGFFYFFNLRPANNVFKHSEFSVNTLEP